MAFSATSFLAFCSAAASFANFIILSSSSFSFLAFSCAAFNSFSLSSSASFCTFSSASRINNSVAAFAASNDTFDSFAFFKDDSVAVVVDLVASVEGVDAADVLVAVEDTFAASTVAAAVTAAGALLLLPPNVIGFPSLSVMVNIFRSLGLTTAFANELILGCPPTPVALTPVIPACCCCC